MGVKTAKSKGHPAMADLHDSIALKEAAAEPRPGGPDASTLRTADFPFRDPPKTGGTRDSRFQIIAKQAVLDDIHTHGKTAMESEVCGVLVGDVYCDVMAPWAYVEHSIRGESAVGKQTQVTITSETWTRIHETLDRDFPGKKIIGWYHTHPGFGIFLSGMDLFIQENFFNQAWQIASVYDPHSEEEGVFIWRDGKATRENFLVEPHAPSPSLFAPASMTQSVDGNAVVAESDQIATLTRRVRSLERRVDMMLTGALFVVLVALIAPLFVFLMGPDSIKRLPGVHQALHRLESEPNKKPRAGPGKDSSAGDGGASIFATPTTQSSSALIDPATPSENPAFLKRANGLENGRSTGPTLIPVKRPGSR
ncbi:MAG TPA: Mov34/MPN/PAD-1 family protein [Tepidisphaeraceae bacterium]|jgi:proteasome lid subunit RPN8/RPN11|nr:Mov34/MPN/PAD-1 family protein [Tepidisphaeraceae bacterium]